MQSATELSIFVGPFRPRPLSPFATPLRSVVKRKKTPGNTTYCCSRNLVRPLCLTMVSEDRFISPRLNRWEEQTHVRSRAYPGIVRTHTEQWPPSLFSPRQADSSFSESRVSVNGKSNKKRISCTIVFVKRFTQLLYCDFIFIKLFSLNVSNTRRFQHYLISILINYSRNLK